MSSAQSVVIQGTKDHQDFTNSLRGIPVGPEGKDRGIKALQDALDKKIIKKDEAFQISEKNKWYSRKPSVGLEYGTYRQNKQ
jgi:hypothetical protein